jgi:hypothetical protein
LKYLSKIFKEGERNLKISYFTSILSLQNYIKMALVMLPCDLPWWTTVTKRLTAIEESTNLEEILDNMLKIHDLCK